MHSIRRPSARPKWASRRWISGAKTTPSSRLPSMASARREWSGRKPSPARLRAHLGSGANGRPRSAPARGGSRNRQRFGRRNEALSRRFTTRAAISRSCPCAPKLPAAAASAVCTATGLRRSFLKLHGNAIIPLQYLLKPLTVNKWRDSVLEGDARFGGFIASCSYCAD